MGSIGNPSRVRAASLGLPSEREEDLLAALFADGVSTRTEVTETSGRGVGLAAVLASAQLLGGRLSVMSRPGKGSCCVIRFPLSAMQAAA